MVEAGGGSAWLWRELVIEQCQGCWRVVAGCGESRSDADQVGDVIRNMPEAAHREQAVIDLDRALR